jgi:DNA-binding GntR family transcriptional regulator
MRFAQPTTTGFPRGRVFPACKRLVACYIVNNRSLTSVNADLLSATAATSFRVDRLPKSTFRQHIAERLRSAILAGDIAPGAQLVESTLAAQFNVSRGPLREALRQLVEEGLLVTVPYTGTHVISLSVDDVREIYSMRIMLERFAFEQAWAKRDAAFRRELHRRNDVLTASIDTGNDSASILAELDLHGLVYEASGHRLLQRTWQSLRGRLQLYWAAHHRAHGTRGPRRDSHDSYVAAALGDDLDAMLSEISSHMGRGAQQTEKFLQLHVPVPSQSPQEN